MACLFVVLLFHTTPACDGPCKLSLLLQSPLRVAPSAAVGSTAFTRCKSSTLTAVAFGTGLRMQAYLRQLLGVPLAATLTPFHRHACSVAAGHEPQVRKCVAGHHQHSRRAAWHLGGLGGGPAAGPHQL